MPKVIYYDHKRRQCFDEDGDQSKPISLAEARAAYEAGLDDFNLALSTLANNDWDMEAVEAYYREADKAGR